MGVLQQSQSIQIDISFAASLYNNILFGSDISLFHNNITASGFNINISSGFNVSAQLDFPGSCNKAAVIIQRPIAYQNIPVFRRNIARRFNIPGIGIHRYAIPCRNNIVLIFTGADSVCRIQRYIISS